MSHSNLVFVEERPDLHLPLQQTNEQALTTSEWRVLIYLQLIFLPFTYWAEVNLCTLINRRWERIIISARSFTDFQEKIVVTVLTTTSSVVFSKVHMCFFPWVGSSVRHSVPKFVGSLLNHLYRCANENVTVKPLSFNLIWLYFKYHFLAQKLSSLWKIFL